MDASELSRYCFLAGALPYLFLGTAHALATPLRPGEAKGLSPSDPALSEAMTRSHPRMTRRTDIWLAWVGFNFSHSLGVVLFGAFVVLLGRDADTFARNAALALPLSLLASLVLVGLAANYWFKTPLRGCIFSALCFLVSGTLFLRA